MKSGGKQENNEKTLKTSIKNMLNHHIKQFKPKLIVVTNAFASRLIYYAIKGEEHSRNEDKCNIYYHYQYKEGQEDKEKIIPIIFSGMVSQFMDNFSKERLKRDINETMKDLKMI